MTAGWRDRESDTDELAATLDGRGRHLHIYGGLADVLDSDRRFAAAALPIAAAWMHRTPGS